MNKTEYKNYLGSKHWKNIRNVKLNRFDGKRNRCSICGSKNTINVHHLTYENLFNEKQDDLRLLCSKCHESAHKIIPTLYRKDGVHYKQLTNNGRFTLLKNAIKKYYGLKTSDSIFKNKNESLKDVLQKRIDLFGLWS